MMMMKVKVNPWIPCTEQGVLLVPVLFSFMFVVLLISCLRFYCHFTPLSFRNKRAHLLLLYGGETVGLVAVVMVRRSYSNLLGLGC